MKIELYYGEYCEHLLNKEKETLQAMDFSFQPVPSITISSCHINMNSDFKGDARIELSNGDWIDYESREVFRRNGPESVMSFEINGHFIGEDELLEKHLSSDGTWVNSLMNIYMDWYKNKK